MNNLENLQISELALLNDSLEESHTQEELHQQTNISTKKSISWSIIVLISLSFLLAINFTLDVYQSYNSIAESSSIIAMLYLLIYIAALIGVLSYVGISIQNYTNLKIAFEIQKKTLNAKSYEQEREVALLILKHYMNHQDEKIKEIATVLYTQTKENSLHSPFVDIKEQIINHLDKKATQKVYSSAKEVSLFTTFAPGSALDSFAVIFSSLKLMKNIFHIYGYRTNIFTSLLIIRKILENASIAALIEYADDSVSDLLGNSLLSKISTKVAQGIGNGLLMLRIGNILIQSARPFASNGSISSYKQMVQLFVKYIKSKLGKKS